jgi:cold shock CspA family protein
MSPATKGSVPMRGTMLWFNEVKDYGMISTEQGERLPVIGSAFVDGKKPVSRCAGTVVSFELTDAEGTQAADKVAFVPAEVHGRARPRRSGFRAG